MLMESRLEIRRRTDHFAEAHGRRPRIYLTFVDDVGVDRRLKSLAADFADMGFNVDINIRPQSPENVVRTAMENDVHIIGLSGLSADHEALIDALFTAMERAKETDMTVAFWIKSGNERPRVDRGHRPPLTFDARQTAESCAAALLDAL